MSAFEGRRRWLLADFTPPQLVTTFLHTNHGLPDGAAAAVARGVGGHLKDLSKVILAMEHAAGASNNKASPVAWARTIAALHADSKSTVVRHWERLIDEGNDNTSPRGARIGAYKRGLRFWAVAELLARNAAIPRAELAASVFAPTNGAAAEEIVDIYLRHGLITYCRPPPPVPKSAAEEDSLLEYDDGGTDDDGSAHEVDRYRCAEDVTALAARDEALWVTTSPRVRAALTALVADEACQRYRRKAEDELAKHEQQQRIAQLAERRREQSAETDALARLIGALDLEEDELARASFLTAQHDLMINERQRTVTELRRVRREYDALKWKGRWTNM